MKIAINGTIYTAARPAEGQPFQLRDPAGYLHRVQDFPVESLRGALVYQMQHCAGDPDMRALLVQIIDHVPPRDAKPLMSGFYHAISGETPTEYQVLATAPDRWILQVRRHGEWHTVADDVYDSTVAQVQDHLTQDSRARYARQKLLGRSVEIESLLTRRPIWRRGYFRDGALASVSVDVTPIRSKHMPHWEGYAAVFDDVVLCDSAVTAQTLLRAQPEEAARILGVEVPA